MEEHLFDAYIALLKSSAGLQWEVSRHFVRFQAGRRWSGSPEEVKALEQLARRVAVLNADWAALIQQTAEHRTASQEAIRPTAPQNESAGRLS